jgi:hypothetical protein
MTGCTDTTLLPSPCDDVERNRSDQCDDNSRAFRRNQDGGPPDGRIPPRQGARAVGRLSLHPSTELIEEAFDAARAAGKIKLNLKLAAGHKAFTFVTARTHGQNAGAIYVSEWSYYTRRRTPNGFTRILSTLWSRHCVRPGALPLMRSAGHRDSLRVVSVLAG